MFKTVVTLLHGSAAEAAEDLADRNARLILDRRRESDRVAGSGGTRHRALGAHPGPRDAYFSDFAGSIAS
jgi:hypothetical protein